MAWTCAQLDGEDMAEQLKGLFSQMGGARRKTRKLAIREALRLLVDEEAAKLVNDKKKTAEVQKRIAQYPKDSADPKPAAGPVSIDEAEKEDRAINGTVRGKGIITINRQR